MDWQDLARRQAAVVSRAQLMRAGRTASQIDGLIARRDLVELMPSVYSPRPVPASISQREWAAVLWSGGVLSHRSAARRWRLPVPDPTLVHVTVDDRKYRHPNGMVRLHRVPLHPAQVTTADGLAISGRARTIIDLLRTERLEAATTLLDRALQREWIEPDTLSAAIQDGRGRAGNRQLRELYAGIEPGTHAESERRLHSILKHHGLQGWQPQHPVHLPHGTVFIDVAFPSCRLAIEVDGKLWHDEYSDRFEGDRERQNDLVCGPGGASCASPGGS